MSKAAPRYILTALLLLLLVNFPLLSVANRPVFVGGIPLLYLYIALVWVLAIILLFSITKRFQQRGDE